MLKNVLSFRPTIFAGVLIIAALSLAACSPVAIMMPQTGVMDYSAISNESAPGYYVRAPGYAAANPNLNVPGFYVRAPGYVAANPNLNMPGFYVRAPGYVAANANPRPFGAGDKLKGEIDVAATPYLISARAAAENSVTGQIDVAATPYLRSAEAAAEGTAALEPATGEILLKVAADPRLGNILVDGRGFTLYMFTKDEPDKSNCSGGCLDAWPPLLSMENLAVGNGVDASLLGTAALQDGSLIVTYNHMPLYFWQDDMQPGDTKGQGVNDVWFVVSPEGQPVGM